MDDEFWGRLHGAFSDDELADLTICCGCFLGMGRTLAVVGVRCAGRAHPGLRPPGGARRWRRGGHPVEFFSDCKRKR